MRNSSLRVCVHAAAKRTTGCSGPCSAVQCIDRTAGDLLDGCICCQSAGITARNLDTCIGNAQQHSEKGRLGHDGEGRGGQRTAAERHSGTDARTQSPSHDRQTDQQVDTPVDCKHTTPMM